MMLRCDEVTRLCASGTLSDAGLGQRLRVRMHLLMCRHCRRYVDQLRAISQAASQLRAGDISDVDESDDLVRQALAARRTPDGPQ